VFVRVAYNGKVFAMQDIDWTSRPNWCRVKICCRLVFPQPCYCKASM